MGQQVVIYSGGSPDNAPMAAAKWNADVSEVYQGADLVGLSAAGSVSTSDLVDILQSQGGVTFTASVGGQSGGTLTAAITSGTYVFLFSDGETQVVTVSTGGTVCTWPYALNAGTITTATAYLRKRSTVGATGGAGGGGSWLPGAAVVTDSTPGSTVNDYSPTGFGATTTLLKVLPPSGGMTITGISSAGRTAATSQPLVVRNISTTAGANVQLPYLSTSSAPLNRFTGYGGGDGLVIPINSALVLMLDTDNWVPMS